LVPASDSGVQHAGGHVAAGFVNACYLYDVAQDINLPALQKRLGARATTARLDDKGAGPQRIRYLQAPVIVAGDVFGCAELGGFAVRVKFYDYGVVSLMLSRPFSGAWSELVALGQTLIESEQLEQLAADACRRFVDQTREAMTAVRTSFLSEDYLVFAVTSLDEPFIADQVIARHGGEIAQLLRGERQPLSQQEQDEVLRHRLSYFAADLVVPAWNAAFVLDTESAALATVEILELANSELLGFPFFQDLPGAEVGGDLRGTAAVQVDRPDGVAAAFEGHAARAVDRHRRQRADRSHGTHGRLHRRTVRGSFVSPGRRTAGRRSVEAGRRGEVEDAGRHPPVRRRANRRRAGQHHGVGGGADPDR